MRIALIAFALTACGAQQIAATTPHTDDHDAAGSAHGHSATTDVPYDAQFIDGMTIHHKAAIAMAEQALQASERPEIKQLAQNIIATQSQEIEQMATWRSQWYAGLATTDGTGGHMGDMELSTDTSIPFDQRFITAMIGHHGGAIDMAQEAQTKAEHEEIKQLAQAIVKAQQAEVQQLQAWEQSWFKQ
jgi:uncharacterized protein (DUF305 family)